MKYKRYLWLTLLLIVVLLTIAVPVLAQTFTADIVVQNSTATDYGIMAVKHTPFATSYMATNGYITATGLDTRVTSGGTAIPHMLADDKLLYATDIGAGSTNNLQFTVGNVALPSGAFYNIVGYGGSVSTADVPALEITNNGIISMKSYVNTAVAGNLEAKRDAIYTFSDGAGNVTAGIISSEAYTLTVTKDGAYHDVDVSAFVGSDANGVILEVSTTAAGSEYMSFRMKGSTDDRFYKIAHQWVVIGIDSNKKFEAKITNAATAVVNIRGYTYTGGGWNFNTNAVDKSLAGVGAWTNIDVSANVPVGTVGVIVQVVNTAAADDYYFGVRKDGSADNRVTGYTRRERQSYAVIGVDPATRIFEGYISNVAVDFYLIGYITGGSVFATNATDKSLAGVGAWTDIDVSAIAPASNFVFVEVYDAGVAPNTDFGFRRNGSPETIYTEMFDEHGWAVVETDKVQIIEGEIAVNTLDFFVVGYATSGIRTPISTKTYAATRTVAVAPADVTVTVTLVGGTFSLAVTGGVTHSAAYAGSVPDSTDNWVWLSNVTPYCEFIRLTKAGNEVVEYQPISYIVGTTLPDTGADGVAHNGTIVWGTNPTGVTVSIDDLTFTGTADVNVVLQTPDALGTFTNPDDFIPTEEGLSGGIPDFQALINLLAGVSNTPIPLFWQFLAGVLILVVFIGGASLASGNLWVGGGVATAMTGYAVAVNILPWYMLLIMVSVTIYFGLSQRTPSL